MPAKAKVTKEMIVDAAFAVARETGAGNINARTVSERLNCSTQPVMYHFATIEELKQTVYAKADRYHVDSDLLRSAVTGQSAERSCRDRILCKRFILHPAGDRYYCLYTKERLAEAVWTLQIACPCTAVPVLCAACHPGVGESMERYCVQLLAGRNSVPYHMHAMRRIPGGSDFQRLPVCCHRKG